MGLPPEPIVPRKKTNGMPSRTNGFCRDPFVFRRESNGFCRDPFVRRPIPNSPRAGAMSPAQQTLRSRGETLGILGQPGVSCDPSQPSACSRPCDPLLQVARSHDRFGLEDACAFMTQVGWGWSYTRPPRILGSKKWIGFGALLLLGSKPSCLQALPSLPSPAWIGEIPPSSPG
jgi:hypothetical protein